jgi:RimJ/RimL family protein N-acetyltransferase
VHLVDVWPLHSLRLTTADLELRPTTEAELPALCSILPPDLEADPTSTRYAGLDDRANQRAVLAQSYWRAMGAWSPHDWVLPFAVRHHGQLVGMQALEGPDWTAERTVDSWSWLAVAARGQGWGKQMRAAVLALAFGPLEARAAISSAVVDNLSSLGVSRALGYRDTHGSVLEHSGQSLRHVRLDRSQWLASGMADGIAVAGVDRSTLTLFGLDGDT